jgi:hypothetical protein
VTCEESGGFIVDYTWGRLAFGLLWLASSWSSEAKHLCSVLRCSVHGILVHSFTIRWKMYSQQSSGLKRKLVPPLFLYFCLENPLVAECKCSRLDLDAEIPFAGVIVMGALIEISPGILPPYFVMSILSLLAPYYPKMKMPATDMSSTFDATFGDTPNGLQLPVATRPSMYRRNPLWEVPLPRPTVYGSSWTSSTRILGPRHDRTPALARQTRSYR